MEAKPIIVPQHKDPILALVELGNRTKNSWTFLHESVLQNLKKIKEDFEVVGPLQGTTSSYLWQWKDELTTRKLGVAAFPVPRIHCYLLVHNWNVEELAFSCLSSIPKNTFLVIMESEERLISKILENQKEDYA